MIDTRLFEKYGFDTVSLKKLLTSKNPSDKTKKLTELLRGRAKDGAERSLKDYRTWAAVDLAYDAPFHQETPTIIRSILANAADADAARSAVKSWGLCEGDLFCSTKVTVQGKETDALALNAPLFFTTLVPVVRAYHTVRTAKIFNDRNIDPLLKYEPIKYTAKNRIKCEIVTDIERSISTQMGYTSVLRQLIFNPGLYSLTLMFPTEPWYSETQKDNSNSDFIVRQGVRYVLPHITNTFYDLQYPLSSFNTDTGCTFGGYWTIARFGDIDGNDKYWNKERIGYGFNWMAEGSSYRNYFTQAYPCVKGFPVAVDNKETDREKIANVYTSADYDKSVFVTHQFAKLVPKDWGIGSYEHPVWFRFIMASDDTVLYAEPFPYSPIIYAGYDADQNRGKNSSLALEVIPSQDMLGNLLTQVVLTIKRNLANLTFYDTNLGIEEQLREFQLKSQWQYKGLQFVGYDSAKNRMGNVPNPRDAIHTVQPQFADTTQMLAAINTIIAMLERLLVISPQEIGSAASHQQSKAEVVIVAGNTTNRVSYTASFIDEAIDAWKRQQYDAIIAYMDDDFVAEISTDIPDLKKHLDELGIKQEEEVRNGRKVVVKAKKEHLRLEGFASHRAGPERGNDAASGQAMFTALGAMNQNPAVAQVVDPLAILEMYEQAAKLLGADDDFKVRTNKDAVQSQQLLQNIEAIKQSLMQQVNKEIGKPAAEAIAAESKEIQAVRQQLTELAAAFVKFQEIANMAAQPQPVPPLEQLPPLNDNPNLAPVPDAAGSFAPVA